MVAAKTEESETDILKRIDAETVKLEGIEYSKLELELRSLQARALKGDLAASKLLDKKRAAGGLQSSKVTQRSGGVLVVPAPLGFDEWDAKAALQQAKFREKID